MQTDPTAFSLENAIMAEVRRRVAEVLAEEVEKARAEVRERLAGEVDALALKVSRYYSMERQADHLIIRVQKPEHPTHA